MTIQLPIFPVLKSDYKEPCVLYVALRATSTPAWPARILTMNYNGVRMKENVVGCDNSYPFFWIKDWDGTRIYLHILTEEDVAKDPECLMLGDFVPCAEAEADYWMEDLKYYKRDPDDAKYYINDAEED
jgi:hypothetical protein